MSVCGTVVWCVVGVWWECVSEWWKGVLCGCVVWSVWCE